MDDSKHPDTTEFLGRFRPLAWKIAGAFAPAGADRDDLVQEILISLLAAHRRVPNDCHELTFVYRVALNRAISWQRKEATYFRHLNVFRQQSERSSVSDQVERDENVALLYAAIRRLPEVDRALVLMHLDERSYREMSEILGLTENAVGQRLSRVRKRLAKELQRQEPPHES